VRRWITVVALTLALGALVAVSAAGGNRGTGKGHGHGKHVFPATIALPNGFAPEGIDIRGQTFYVGSIPTGRIFRGSLRTGEGSVLVTPPAGRAAIGLQADKRGRLFVAGGGTGHAYVYDTRTGADLGSYELTELPSFINDVVVTRRAVWFTDSVNQVLYKLALGPHGELPAAAQTVPLTGDITYTMGFNANGIDATPNGRTLIIVQSNEGLLFRVDAATGVAKLIDLGGTRVRNGDGILLHGKRLYVVQNLDNLISVIRLRSHLQGGSLVRQITDPRFQVPTTIDRFGPWLYAVNARFGTEVTPETTYTVVRVRR
jgi:sugar lactone lactonase YvrE